MKNRTAPEDRKTIHHFAQKGSDGNSKSDECALKHADKAHTSVHKWRPTLSQNFQAALLGTEKTKIESDMFGKKSEFPDVIFFEMQMIQNRTKADEDKDFHQNRDALQHPQNKSFSQ